MSVSLLAHPTLEQGRLAAATIQDGERLQPLDAFFSCLDTRYRSVDCAVLVYLDLNEMGLEQLREALNTGFAHAYRCFPQAGMARSNGRWRQLDANPVVNFIPLTLDTTLGNLQPYYSEPLATDKAALQLQLFHDDQQKMAVLLMRMHHSVGDANAGFMFLEVGFAHAFGVNQLVTKHATASLELKQFKPKPKEQDKEPVPFSFPIEHSRKSGKKALNLRFESAPLREHLAKLDIKASYNDLLLALCHQAVRSWTQRFDNPESLTFYLPINSRKQAHYGFGNASGVIYINDQMLSPDASLQEAIVYFRQRFWKCYRRGDWIINIPKWLHAVPFRVLNVLVRLINRLQPRGKASVIFSHLDNSAADWRQDFPMIKRMIGVGSLIHGYPFMINALSLTGETNLTITYNDDERGNAAIVALAGNIKQTIEQHITDTDIQLEF